MTATTDRTHGLCHGTESQGGVSCTDLCDHCRDRANLPVGAMHHTTHDPNEWASVWRFADREAIAEAMDARAWTNERDRREAQALVARAITAELDAANAELDNVMYFDGDKLSGEGLSRLAHALMILRDLHAALAD